MSFKDQGTFDHVAKSRHNDIDSKLFESLKQSPDLNLDLLKEATIDEEI